MEAILLALIICFAQSGAVNVATCAAGEVWATTDPLYYYQCLAPGVAVQLKCPEDTYFDGDGCVDGVPPAILLALIVCFAQSGAVDVDTCTAGEVWATTDALYYYECLAPGVAVQLKCPEDTYFDGDGCVDGVPPDSSEEDTTTTTSTTTTTTTPSTTTTSSTTTSTTTTTTTTTPSTTTTTTTESTTTTEATPATEAPTPASGSSTNSTTTSAATNAATESPTPPST
ncbi:unnamed protein product [Hermetia illucens]|uniref:Uncharacterized protein n=1 Tax=Hermetia illucens TaxID=343691 RepID=A0A7R8V1G4_HERIL|nr:unnamed protein product [Hermetia illucens]